MSLAIIDFNGTLYDPFRPGLMPGAKELLEALKMKGVPVVVVSKQELDGSGRLKQLGIDEYINEAIFVDQKTGEHFREIMERHGAKPEETYVIGDYLAFEIRAGVEAGAFTIHYKGGHRSGVAEDSITPNATIDDLSDALQYIR